MEKYRRFFDKTFVTYNLIFEVLSITTIAVKVLVWLNFQTNKWTVSVLIPEDVDSLHFNNEYIKQ